MGDNDLILHRLARLESDLEEMKAQARDRDRQFQQLLSKGVFQLVTVVILLGGFAWAALSEKWGGTKP